MDQLLMRNAELSNSVEQHKKSINELQQEHVELELELKQQKEQNESLIVQIKQTSESIQVNELRETILKMEESLAEKNKTIRLQQQKLNDIKKSLKKGDLVSVNSLKATGSIHFGGPSVGGSHSENEIGTSSVENSPRLTPKRHQHLNSNLTHEPPSSDLSNEINFQYLRNVVLKFITTSEYEAQKHLIKAIAVLLHFSNEEEKLVRETLDWKMSWLASLPLVGNNMKPSLHSLSTDQKSHPKTRKNSETRVPGSRI